MKIVQINATCGSGSTGKICVAVSELLTKRGIENYVLYNLGTSGYPLGIRYMSEPEIKWQALKSRVFGNYGFQSRKATGRLLAELERISPDVVHLHNLHSHNVHLERLFSYLKEKKIKIFWTFHDCWAFTGYCPYFDMAKCDQWAGEGCRHCPQRARYSWFFDRSKALFERKKRLFSDLDMTIITPSQWLADQVKRSFLKDCPVRVINNGIDLSVFSPRESDFRKKYGVDDKYILLGVAFDWGRRKGMDLFIRLAQRLDPEKFRIVLVGTNDKQDELLPKNVISIHRTENQRQLAEIYSAVDLFVNPTREENFPTVNLEALACGTPVLTFRTGGSPESLDEKTGVVVECDDEEALYEAIIRSEEQRPFKCEDCRNRSLRYNQSDKFLEYAKLYF